MAVDITTQGYTKFLDPMTSPQDTVDAIYKIFYLPGVQDTINNKQILSRYMVRGGETVAGEYTENLVKVGRNEGMGYIGDAGRLPDPGKPRFLKAIWRTRYGYIRVLFSGVAVSSARNQRGAYIQVTDAVMRDAAMGIRHDVNRICWGDGSGVLGTVSSVVGANEIAVQNPGGFDNPGPGTQYFATGMRVAILPAGSAPAGAHDPDTGVFGYTITGIDYENQTITLDNTTTWVGVPSADDVIVKISDAASDTGIDNSYGIEPFGIAALIDEGNPTAANVGEIDATANVNWNAVVVDNGGVPIAFDQGMLQRALDDLDQYGPTDGKVDMFCGSHGIRRAYLEGLVQQKQFVGTMTLDGGFRAVLYNGIPWAVDKFATRGRLYGIDFSSLRMFYENDFNWMDQDGSVLSRLENYDAFQATLYRYWSTGVMRRNANVVIKDIEDS